MVVFSNLLTRRLLSAEQSKCLPWDEIAFNTKTMCLTLPTAAIRTSSDINLLSSFFIYILGRSFGGLRLPF